jgi:hypothetical protein
VSGQGSNYVSKTSPLAARCYRLERVRVRRRAEDTESNLQVQTDTVSIPARIFCINTLRQHREGAVKYQVATGDGTGTR